MKPIKTLLFLISVFIVLSLLSLVFPKEGIQIGNNFKLRFPDLQNIIQPKEYEQADISDILAYHQSDMVDDINNIVPDTAIFLQNSTNIITDSTKLVLNQDSTINKDSVQANELKIQPGNIRQHIEYPENNKEILYPFFSQLNKLKSSNELIRILHYGDSQIEGDRITSYIRNELQKKFGGSGIGMFAPVLIKGTNISMKHKLSGTWERYTYQSIKNGNIFHKRLGALMSFGRFVPANASNDQMYQGEITLQKSNLTYRRTREFNQCRVFYGYNDGPFIAELKYKDQTLDAELIPVSRQLNTITWNTNKALDQITISFKGEDSPDIYAIALDDYKGVAVDNIPLRGSSGTDFTRTDLAFLRSMYQRLNVKLIIMEFGVNLVPYIRDDYSYYEKQFYKQLKTLKSLRPDISIIVIGVSDMSQNINGQYVSYPNIVKIREAQKNAAFKADCAFWDMYEAMGGKNSMPAWVNADPPLARTDFTHFSWRGSIVISKMFYEALMNDYNDYLNNSNK